VARRSRQLEFPTWGGRRAGAGRKPIGRTAGVSHRPRPRHDRQHPLHVTLRAIAGLPSLRAGHVFPAVRRALGTSSKSAFRVVHFSVQTNHVHLLLEAESSGTLGRGVQGLAIRLAKAVNRVLRRHGRIWSDRFHARALRTPREVRNALIYVLMNGRKHGVSGRRLDPCSSAAWFEPWRQSGASSPPVARARSWLLNVGWRRGGSLGVHSVPAQTRAAARDKPFPISRPISHAGAAPNVAAAPRGTAAPQRNRRMICSA